MNSKTLSTDIRYCSPAVDVDSLEFGEILCSSPIESGSLEQYEQITIDWED